MQFIGCRSEYNKEHYKLDSTKEAIRESKKRLYKEIQARRPYYRCTRLKRIPKWSESEKIAQVYKNRPEGYHVDHVIPLQGKLVSGLHVLSNLQYLPIEENLRKNNSFDIEEFNK